VANTNHSLRTHLTVSKALRHRSTNRRDDWVRSITPLFSIEYHNGQGETAIRECGDFSDILLDSRLTRERPGTPPTGAVINL
jgi:hypothetical protein